MPVLEAHRIGDRFRGAVGSREDRFRPDWKGDEARSDTVESGKPA
jgi:hypothetical protein